MPFQITVLEADRIIDVVYPSEVTQADMDDYLPRIREAIVRLNGPWRALVDQQKLRVLPLSVVREMAKLNAYAQLKGMERSARVVSDPSSGLQAWRMTKQAGLSIPTRTFETREEALGWLRDLHGD